MNEQQERTAIPDHVQTGSGSANWRIAGGTICKGREKDGTYETRDQVVGLLKRIGVYRGVLKDGPKAGEAYGKLEADFETSAGIVSVGVSITNDGEDKASVVAITYAEALLMCAKDELICVTANLGKKENRHGKFSTYANLHRVDRVTLASTQIRPERTEGDMQDRLDACIEELRTHPAWGDRPERDSESATYTAFDTFEAAAVAKGWPKIANAPIAYAALAQKLVGETAVYPNIGEVPDSAWDAMTAALDKTKTIPKGIVAEAALPSADDEYDPFADD